MSVPALRPRPHLIPVETDNVIPISRARGYRPATENPRAARLVALRDELIAARERLRRASDRVAERIAVVEEQIAHLD